MSTISHDEAQAAFDRVAPEGPSSSAEVVDAYIAQQRAKDAPPAPDAGTPEGRTNAIDAATWIVQPVEKSASGRDYAGAWRRAHDAVAEGQKKVDDLRAKLAAVDAERDRWRRWACQRVNKELEMCPVCHRVNDADKEHDCREPSALDALAANPPTPKGDAP